jgi:membrane-associated phospholipid phosphatase
MPAAELEDPKRSHLERRFLSNLVTDQVEFVKGAGRFRVADLKWALPLAGATGLTLATDPDASRQLAGSDTNRWKTSQNISDAGLLAMGALAGSTYLWGVTSHDDHKRETGVLAIEAATGAVIDNEALKQIFSRDRPDVGTGQGLFFNAPREFPSDASFVSGHAMISWSIASVIAHEYPGWLTQTAVYGLATLTSATRVSGKKHFPTDVVIGSALGWYIGHQVYRAHHDPELGGMDIGTITKPEPTGPPSRNLGSTYVPLESWVYAAIDRLAGMGISGTDMSTMRPWTRLECARIVQEAESSQLAQDLPDKSIGGEIIAALRKEFQYEYDVLDGKPNRNAQVESLYARVQGISGEPLRDGYHFGQTIYNDYGRPYAEGLNFVSGGSAYGAYGPWSVYFRAEYQHAPSAPALPLSARLAIAGDTFAPTPLQPATPFDAVNRARILDAYAAFTVSKWQLSFGKQSLWWGPNHEGSMNFSNNAEPVNMFRISTVHPLDLPWVFHFLGGTKGEFFIGQLEGHQFIRTSKAFFGPPLPRQPYLNGLKLAFKPTENFEFGVSFTSVWGGAGVPITFHTFRRSFSSSNTRPGEPTDPGDRRTGFDFKYRIPGLRKYLTLYNDSMAEDEPNPIAYPRRSAMAPGIYISHLPKLERLDVRAEGFYTDLPGLRKRGIFFANEHYLSGFTNEGNILGHPVGRQGLGYQVSGQYWFGAQKKVKFGHRHVEANEDFLQGGEINDYYAQATWQVREEWQVQGGLQHERWQFPALAPNERTNVTTTFGVVFTPRNLFR